MGGGGGRTRKNLKETTNIQKTRFFTRFSFFSLAQENRSWHVIEVETISQATAP